MSTAIDRFCEKITPVPEAGCWLWDGATTPRGYGKIMDNGRLVYAHRFAFENFVGPIGDKLVLHKCDTPICVNPDHLVLGTHKDNTRQMLDRGRGMWPPGHGDSVRAFFVEVCDSVSIVFEISGDKAKLAAHRSAVESGYDSRYFEARVRRAYEYDFGASDYMQEIETGRAYCPEWVQAVRIT